MSNMLESFGRNKNTPEKLKFTGFTVKFLEDAMELARKLKMPLLVGLYLLVTGCQKESKIVTEWINAVPNDGVGSVIPPDVSEALNVIIEKSPSAIVIDATKKSPKLDEDGDLDGGSTDDDSSKNKQTYSLEPLPLQNLGEVSSDAKDIPHPTVINTDRIPLSTYEEHEKVGVEGSVSFGPHGMGAEIETEIPIYMPGMSSPLLLQVSVEKEPGEALKESKASLAAYSPTFWNVLHAGGSVTMNLDGQKKISFKLGTPEDSHVQAGMELTPNRLNSFKEKGPAVMGSVGYQGEKAGGTVGVGEHGFFVGGNFFVPVGKKTIKLAAVYIPGSGTFMLGAKTHF